METTSHLLERIRGGDLEARERLLSRYLPSLTRWAHGRLPPAARDLSATDDVVQNTLIRALSHLAAFEPHRPGAFLAYLRRVLINQIRDEIRRVRRRPGHEELQDNQADTEPSPLEAVIGRQGLEIYEKALASLPEEQQEAIIMSVELGFTHQQVAEAIGSPSANAARMFVARALVRLAEAMHAG